MALTNSCNHTSDPELELISSKVFTHYPSASAIEYNEGKLYVFGDDAPFMLITDSLFESIDSVHYLSDTSYRMSKETKADIESATLFESGGKKFMYAMGSYSDSMRKEVFQFDLDNLNMSLEFKNRDLFTDPPVKELNIEGLCKVKERLVMSNRANTTHRVNQFIITSDFDFRSQKIIKDDIHVINVQLPLQSVAGISGLCYYSKKDILFFTASEEDTPSASQDGTINDSYLGWIENFSEKIKNPKISPTHLLKLSESDRRFIKQKIESVCIEKVSGQDYFLFLAADNDNGQSTLFRVRLHLPD